MTRRTPNLELQKLDFLDMSPEDANRLQLKSDDRIRIVNRYGEATLSLRVTANQRPGELFASFQNPEIHLNRVTSAHRDRFVKTPEYKVTAVRIEKV